MKVQGIIEDKTKWRKMKKLSLEEMQQRLNMDNPFNSIIKNNDVHHTQIICGKCKKEYITSFHTILRSKFKVCVKCAQKLQKTKLKDIEEIKQEIKSYGFIPLFNVYKGNHSLFEIQDREGYKGTLSLVSMRRGANISRFAKYNIFALDNLRKYCEDNDINCFIPEQQYNGWDYPINIICECGREYKVTISHFLKDNQHQCSYCSKSKSQNEKIIEEWLNLNNIKFDTQKMFEGCMYKKSLKFDFYLIDYNCCVEVDGEGHEKPTRFNGINLQKAKQLYEETKNRDKIKDEYCLKNKIKLIRINYKDINNNNYKNILSSIIR